MASVATRRIRLACSKTVLLCVPSVPFVLTSLFSASPVHDSCHQERFE
jgi:hypothetical protein